MDQKGSFGRYDHNARHLIDQRVLIARRQRAPKNPQGIITVFAAVCVLLVLVTYMETSRMLIPSKFVTRRDLKTLTSGFTKDIPAVTAKDFSSSRFPRHLTPHPHKPKVIIVGFSHCGGSVITSAMAAHPDVVVSKNSKFFTDDHSLRLYLSQMPPSLDHHVTIDSGFSYITNRTAMKRIKAFNETMKIIVVVCNPISRLLSNHSAVLKKQKLFKGSDLSTRENLKILVQSLKSSISVEGRGEKGDQNSGKKRKILPNRVQGIGDYFKHLVDLFLLFPRKQVHVIEKSRLYKQPISQWMAIHQFLNVSSFHHLTFFDQKAGTVCFNTSTDRRTCAKDPYLNVNNVFSEDNWSLLDSLKHFFRPFNKRLFLYLEDEYDW